MKKIYLILSLVVVILVGAGAFGLWQKWQSSPPAERVKYAPAKISDIKSMVELQTVAVWQEVPFKAAIGGRHLVGRVAVEGTIGFDLEKIKLQERGDTIVVTLPQATVTLRESTRPDAYVIYDTWNDRMLGPAVFSTAEENRAKGRVLDTVRRNLEARGEIARAGKTARETVAKLLSTTTGRPVVCL